MTSLKYIVLAGPTGVGKTDLAIEIAQKLRVEIVGADAFQIYDGLKVLTAKPSAEQLATIPHHLIGTLPLTETCDAHRYSLLARQVIRTLNERGVTPIVSGGTGFYLDALAGTLPDVPPADPVIRRELERLSIEKLLEKLQNHDPVAWKRIDRSNRRRVVRALEICLITKKPFSSFLRTTPLVSPSPRFWLERPRTELYERIDRRVDQMFEFGVVAEVATISEISITASQAIGFRQIRAFLDKKLSDQDCRDSIKRLIRNYSKRQVTWFRYHGYQPISADVATDQILTLIRSETNS